MKDKIIKFPGDGGSNIQKFDFPCGSSLTINVPEGDHLTVSKSIYFLEDVKFQILSMMRAE